MRTFCPFQSTVPVVTSMGLGILGGPSVASHPHTPSAAVSRNVGGMKEAYIALLLPVLRIAPSSVQSFKSVGKND